MKGNENNRTHYLHLVKFNGEIWKNDVFFRDYLREHKKAARAYESLKVRLAKRFPNQRIKYTKAKWDFIKSILSKRSKRTI